MAYCASGGTGQYVASERHMAVFDRSYHPDATKRGVVHHAARTQQVSGFDPANQIVQAICAPSGPALINCDFSNGTTWGNDTGQSRLGSAWAYVKTAFGAKTDKVVLYGISMGMLVCLNWARANPSSVAAIVGISGVVDLADMHDQNRGGYAAEIETAYTNLAGYTSAVAAHNPAVHATDFVGIPMKLWRSSDDTIAIPSLTDTFAATAGATIVNAGSGGGGHIFDFTPYVQSLADFVHTYA